MGLNGGGKVRGVCGVINLAVILIGWWLLPWCFGGGLGGFALLYTSCIRRGALHI